MRSTLRTILFIALAMLAVAALVYRSQEAIEREGFSWARLAEVVHGADGWPLLASLVTIFLVYALRAQRWVQFCRPLGGANFWNVYASTLMGFAAVFLLGRAGEPLRPLLIARKDRLPVSGMFGVYVIERLFDFASIAVLASISLLFFSRSFLERASSRAQFTGALLLAGLLAAIGFLLYFRLHGAGALQRRMESWRRRRGWRARLAGVVAGFSDGLQAIRTPRDFGWALLYSAAHWVLVAVLYVWISHAFGGQLLETGLPEAMILMAFSMVGSTLLLPGVGGGSQLATFLAFTVIFGVEKEPAAAASIVIWLITFAGSSLAGIPLLIREGWSVAELRRLAREEAEAEAAGKHVDSV